MKKRISVLVVAVALLSAGSAWSQTRSFRETIPFPFSVGQQTFPAGIIRSRACRENRDPKARWERSLFANWTSRRTLCRPQLKFRHCAAQQDRSSDLQTDLTQNLSGGNL